jgi:hypothetical protein
MFSAQTAFEVPYVEKYRPVTLEDVVGTSTKTFWSFLLHREYGRDRATETNREVRKHAELDLSRKYFCAKINGVGTAWNWQDILRDVHGSTNVARYC